MNKGLKQIIITHCESKKTNSIFRSLPIFKKFFTFGFSQKFAIEHLSCFPPHLNYVATLPCET